MIKRIIRGCLAFAFFISIESATAASTCDYSEQVELSNIASTVRVVYETKKVVIDLNTNKIVEGMSEDQVSFEDDYVSKRVLTISLMNITDDIYVYLKGDNGFEKTYYYADSKDGIIEFDGGDLSEIVNYKITIYSNSPRCRGESLRIMDFVTPMYNNFFSSYMCQLIPNYDYCLEYVTTPFLKSVSEVESLIFERFYEKQEELKNQSNEENELTLWEQIKEFFTKNKKIILIGTGIVVIVGVATTVWIIKKRRSRVI